MLGLKTWVTTALLSSFIFEYSISVYYNIKFTAGANKRTVSMKIFYVIDNVITSIDYIINIH